MIRLGVLASGRGSNLEAIIAATDSGRLRACISVVLCNRPEALALARAAEYGIPARLVSEEDFPSRLEHNRRMIEILRNFSVDLVVLAGYDRVVHPEFLQAFPMKVINIHPSLLPAFAGGLHAQKEALEYGSKLTGCTVHFVTEEVDGGPIILQQAVAVRDDDTVDTLSLRILEEEHRLLPQAIDLLAQGRLRLAGRRVLGTDGEA